MALETKPPAFTLTQPELQKRLFAAEHKLVILLGSIAPLIPGILHKYAVARLTYEDATHAEAVRLRLGQMRGGKGKEPVLSPQLDAVFEAALRAPSKAALILGIFDVLKRDMARSYSDYLSGTHPLGDLPSRVLLETALEQEQSHLEFGSELAKQLGAGSSDAEWADYLRRRLEAAGGIDGSLSGPEAEGPRPEEEPFELPVMPDWGDHPLRFMNGSDGPNDDVVPYCWDGDARIQRIGIYTWLFHEADVLDYLPPMFHKTQGMPFEFHFDLARHLWDEARHSEGGYRGLQRLGLDPKDSDHPVFIRLATKDLDPVDLYAMMTQGFEAGSFPLKSRIMPMLDSLQDEDLSTFLRYDRADETMHVAFGHKWVPHLAQHLGRSGSLREIVASIKERFAVNVREALEEFPIERTVERARRHSYNRFARELGVPEMEDPGRKEPGISNRVSDQVAPVTDAPPRP